MEDTLIIFLMEDDLIFFLKWKSNSIFFCMESDLILLKWETISKKKKNKGTQNN